MATRKFFDISQEQSQVKTAIVSKYFWAWAKVIMPWARRGSGKIAYLDLFAGPGRYQDGTKSTPLFILETAIADDQMKNMLISIFNDVNSDNSKSLQRAIDELPGISSLRYKPVVYNEEVGTRLVKMFENLKLVPTLFFVDPWGYKGLSLRLINSVLRNWGCDAIFFFNYNRISMGLPNNLVEEHMNALFEKDRADAIRAQIAGSNPAARESIIIEGIAEALRDMGGEYVLPFRFRNSSGTRTSHHLIFVSKNIRGYEIMKEIMARESSGTEQGVPTFEYNPRVLDQGILFELSKPLEDLGKMLLSDFAGKSLRMEQIYSQHHVGKRFIKSNYKWALADLESKELITATPPAAKRRRNTFGDNVIVCFPSNSAG
jgi:three-Cys-motif partner protein